MGLVFSLPTFPAWAEAPAILLAGVYRQQVDVSRYLVSEKLDGVRAVWDGSALRFRSGKEINAPPWFVAALPKQPLDGELWLGRGSFDRLSGIVRREIPDENDWREVRYMIFELPGGSGPFGDRAEQIRQLVVRPMCLGYAKLSKFQRSTAAVWKNSSKKSCMPVVRA
jgi:DNA ligase-1